MDLKRKLQEQLDWETATRYEMLRMVASKHGMKRFGYAAEQELPQDLSIKKPRSDTNLRRANLVDTIEDNPAMFMPGQNTVPEPHLLPLDLSKTSPLLSALRNVQLTNSICYQSMHSTDSLVSSGSPTHPLSNLNTLSFFAPTLWRLSSVYTQRQQVMIKTANEAAMPLLPSLLRKPLVTSTLSDTCGTTNSCPVGNERKESTTDRSSVSSAESEIDVFNIQTLRNHAGSTSPTENLLQCKLCNAKLRDRAHRKKHMETQHTVKLYNCYMCCRAYKQARDYRAHVATHRNGTIFKCDMCSTVLSNPTDYLHHLKGHRQKDLLSCKHCDRYFRDSCTLATHMRTHTGEKPYKCEICSKKFRQSGTYIRHKKVHRYSVEANDTKA